MRIFISYKRGASPDEALALAVFGALRPEHTVFIDQTMLVGEAWAKRIQHEIEQADFLITLLSARSVESEMVRGEIETARRVSAQRPDGGPRILPVRVAFFDAFQYPLSAYLNQVQWAIWKSSDDTPAVIDSLTRAIMGARITPVDMPVAVPAPSNLQAPQPSAQPFLDIPEGTMGPESRFYIEREQDNRAMAAIRRRGVTVPIKAPRQMGKSSLLMRLMAEARRGGKRVAFLDFQLLDAKTRGHSETFFRAFCAWISDTLEITDRVDEYFSRPLPNIPRCTRYIGSHVLKELGTPLVLAMDEVDTLFDTDYRDDFFAMLRAWHNQRADKPEWNRLDLLLVTSTEPYQLIQNLNQSPFNVGEVIELGDFQQAQIMDLNLRHGSPFGDGQVQELVRLLGGHPYLIRKALYQVASGRLTAADLLATAADSTGVFGDHLRHHLFRLTDQPELIEGLRSIIRNGTCSDERVFFRLRGAGLVRRDGDRVLPRCQLYARFFSRHLHVG
jgi:hypothetical protein